LCCSAILLIAEVVSEFKKIGSFARKLQKLGFKLKNKSSHRLIPKFSKFHQKKNRNEQIPQLDSKFPGS